MNNKKIVSYRKNGTWHKYNGEKLPDTVDAVELYETMTLDEFEKAFPGRHVKALLQPMAR